MGGEDGPVGINDEGAFPTAEGLGPAEGSLRQGPAVRAEAQQIVKGAPRLVFVQGHPAENSRNDDISTTGVLTDEVDNPKKCQRRPDRAWLVKTLTA
jgi:hypothetical protein